MSLLIIVLTILISLTSYSYKITDTSIYNFIKKENYEIVNNELFYKKENTKENYSGYLTILDKETVDNVDEIYSMFYTILNNGYDSYTFKCNYNCFNDLEKIDQEKLSIINQLVSVRNSYNEIKTTYTTSGNVTLIIDKKYSKEDLERIDNELDRLIKELNINNYTNLEDKIKIFHDYIANKNTYDKEMANNGSSEYHSNTAIGPLFEGKGICDGYSDVLSLFLDKIGIENIKITNKDHVWNYVKVNNNWYHIDLTWDDPIYTNGKELTIHDYFLITTNELTNKKDGSHNYDIIIYDFVK